MAVWYRRWPAAVAAVATVCAALAVLLASSSPPSVGTPVVERHPPPVRSESMLRRAGGVLWWATGDCRLYRDAMARQRIDRAPGKWCRAWPSPDGATVLAAPAEGPTMPPPGVLEVLDGRSFLKIRMTELPADLVVGPVVWSPDLPLAAACVAKGLPRPQIDVIAPPWRKARSVRGRCSPAFNAAGTMLTTDGSHVFENGFDLHLDDRLAAAVGSVPGRYRVTALTALPFGIAVAVHSGSADAAAGAARSAIVLVDQERRKVTSLPTADGASELGAAPDGSELWYRDAVHGRCLLLPLLRPPPPGLPRVAEAFAFSPDGRYAAAATARQVVVVDTRTGARGLVPALNAVSMAWTS